MAENWVEEEGVCDIPIGRDDTGGSPVCVFYRDGLYREKLAEILEQKLQKLEKQIKFELNGSFRGAFAT